MVRGRIVNLRVRSKATIPGRESSLWFWGVLLLVIAVVTIPRLLIFDFSLPYIDYPDEPTFYTIVKAWRGEGVMPQNGSG